LIDELEPEKLLPVRSPASFDAKINVIGVAFFTADSIDVGEMVSKADIEMQVLPLRPFCNCLSSFVWLQNGLFYEKARAKI